MDREDQEHFRTIATALPPQQTDFKKASAKAASSSSATTQSGRYSERK